MTIGQTNTNIATFRKAMNPESWAVNAWLGKDENGEEKFKSYLNPLCTYSNDEEASIMEKWSDPLLTTLDANSETKHWGYLNPVHNIFSDKEAGENEIKWGEAFMDPGLACATSFIKDEKVSSAARLLLNPVGTLVGYALNGIGDGFSRIFKGN